MPRALIVDDSPIMRKHLTKVLTEAGFETFEARNGHDCLEQIPKINPDVITLDINMPVMDGIECLKHIMKLQAIPVVMVSSLTEKGAKETFEALSLGAVDYIHKPNGTWSQNMGESTSMLVAKVKNAAWTKLQKRYQHLTQTHITQETKPLRGADSLIRAQVSSIQSKADLIVIGVSTGGPNCLQKILPKLPANLSVPIVIAQHMPARFTKVFAERLNKECAMEVIEVTQKTKLQNGHIYLAQGDADILVNRDMGQLFANSVPSSKEYVWHPSVTRLVESSLQAVTASRLCCIQLTGMGDDGAKAMKVAYDKGSTTIVESEETTVVNGMPGELVKLQGASIVVPNHKISNLLI